MSDSLARIFRQITGEEPSTRSGLLKEARILEREAKELIAGIPNAPYEAGGGMSVTADMKRAKAKALRGKAKALASKDAAE